MHLGLAEFQSDVDLQTSGCSGANEKELILAGKQSECMYKGLPIKDVANIFLSFFNPLHM